MFSWIDGCVGDHMEIYVDLDTGMSLEMTRQAWVDAAGS